MWGTNPKLKNHTMREAVTNAIAVDHTLFAVIPRKKSNRRLIQLDHGEER